MKKREKVSEFKPAVVEPKVSVKEPVVDSLTSEGSFTRENPKDE